MKKIVVVDDNKMFLNIVKDFIEIHKDFECVTFSNPEDALQYVLDEKEIHAVVSDYEMPQMNGFTLAKKIIEAHPATMIIVMSGHDTNYLRVHALKAEIDENKIRLLCKSDIINLCELLKNHQKTLTTYCKRCDKNYEVSEDRIFSGGDFSTYATRCPVCGFGRGLPFKEVEKVFGNLKV